MSVFCSKQTRTNYTIGIISSLVSTTLVNDAWKLRACASAFVCACGRACVHACGYICSISPHFRAVYTQERLQAVRSLHRYLRDDFLTTKHIIQTSLSSHPMLALDRSIYKWGRRSENVHLEVDAPVTSTNGAVARRTSISR